MAIKLFDSELKVMGVLWREGDQTAKRISDILYIILAKVIWFTSGYRQFADHTHGP